MRESFSLSGEVLTSCSSTGAGLQLWMAPSLGQLAEPRNLSRDQFLPSMPSGVLRPCWVSGLLSKATPIPTASLLPEITPTCCPLQPPLLGQPCFCLLSAALTSYSGDHRGPFRGTAKYLKLAEGHRSWSAHTAPFGPGAHAPHLSDPLSHGYSQRGRGLRGPAESLPAVLWCLAGLTGPNIPLVFPSEPINLWPHLWGLWLGSWILGARGNDGQDLQVCGLLGLSWKAFPSGDNQGLVGASPRPDGTLLSTLDSAAAKRVIFNENPFCFVT